VHADVAAAVDSLLRGYPLPPEIRSREDGGEIRIERPAPPPRAQLQSANQGYRRQAPTNGGERAPGRVNGEGGGAAQVRFPPSFQTGERGGLQTIRIYPYGVARNRLLQAAKRLSVPAVVVDEPDEADVLVTLRSYYRKRQHTIVDAEHRGVPIYVLRANTINQMQQFLSDIFNLSAEMADDGGEGEILQETQAAINAVLNGERWVELQPASASVRRLQHQMARQANLLSHSYGKEPRRRVRIFRE
jgi:hypothetical protein